MTNKQSQEYISPGQIWRACPLEGGELHIKRAFKDVFAQFIGQMRLMNQATTEI
jgi:hypothetical protein